MNFSVAVLYSMQLMRVNSSIGLIYTLKKIFNIFN